MMKSNLRYDGIMRCGRSLLLVTALLSGCTKENKQRECLDGTCTAAGFPFCDVTGFVSGEPGTCIAVTCIPGKFGECRGDQEVRCNAAGNNYDVVQCERGCDPNADGCRLCSPGETACTNGKVATCDADGAVISSTECVLGCFENQPRCREVDPSNGLGKYLDMVPSPPDIDLTDAVASTVTGEIMDVSGPVAVPNFLFPAAPQGAPIRVFVVHNARIQKLVVGTSPNDYTAGPAIAIVASGDVMVTGLLQVLPSAGSLSTSGCAGASGLYAKDCLDVVSGAGGGAHATNGAKGGDVAGHVGGGPGIASGTMSLQPLRGGCGGGGTDGPAGNYYDGGFGGGAVQVSSMREIVIDGIIDAKGQDGVSDRYGQENGFFITGGGAGGGVLLEAPTVTLDVNGQLLASGGGGAGLCSTATSYCGLFGLGAHTSTAAQAGGNAMCDGIHFTSAGSGGGGLGRIRVNTRDGTYSVANTAVEDGAVTTGTHATR